MSCLPLSEETCQKYGTASEDYFTRQIVKNFKLLELVIRATKKISKARLLSNQLKRWNNCILYNCNRKRNGKLHTDLPKIKVKNLDDFYAAYYSFTGCFSAKYFSKLSELSSKLVRLVEFIIKMQKRRISLKMQFSIRT